MEISIIIPNYNGAKLLPSCLDSIKKALTIISPRGWLDGLPRGGLAMEILLVDNGSTDNSLILLKEKYPWVKVIPLDKNHGFAKAANEGIENSSGEIILLINTDLQLKDNFFHHLSKHLRGGWMDSSEVESLPNYIFFATRVLNQTGSKIDSCGIEYEFYGKACKRFTGLPANTPQALKESEVLGANASCAIYKREFFDKLGLFDEDFHSYLEDVDISLRAHFRSLKCLYLPSLISYHQGQATSKQMGLYKAKQDVKNNLLLIINNYPPSLILKNLFPLILERLRNLNGLRKTATSTLGKSKGCLITLSTLVFLLPQLTIKIIRHSLSKNPPPH